ncbi:MAG: hypothetical protein J7L11_05890 [Thermoprotei archaeon]|nr:hypothetical protein [Thermoprotei archaeon]
MTKKVTCPNCGSTFDISYSRGVMCTGCKYSVFGNCGYVVCPRCGHEFPLSPKGLGSGSFNITKRIM